MSSFDPQRDRIPIADRRRIDNLCAKFETAYRQGESPIIEDFAKEFEGDALVECLFQLVLLEVACRFGSEVVSDEVRRQYEQRFASHPSVCDRVFRDREKLRQGASHLAHIVGHAIHIRCPNCRNEVTLATDSPFIDIECTSCGSHFSVVGESNHTLDVDELGNIGHFELIERLGVGGFGSVWKARDTQLDRTVAVKVPRRGHLRPHEQEKFLREARAAAQLKHPNIVSVHEVGRDVEADLVYIVSDVVPGVALSDWRTGKELSFTQASELCAAIADALSHAHREGVIHRDLKPHNILLDADGQPHITDFGLAKREGGEVTVTLEGQVLGTPAYMAPEQASGNAHNADGRADVYSLGVILFELLTGELPFRGNARMLIHQVIHDDAPSPRKLNGLVGKDLETICLKCLEKEPSKRYQSAALLADDLRRYVAKKPILARPIGLPAKAWRWCLRNKKLAWSLALTACVLLAASIINGALAYRLAKSEKDKTLIAVDALIGESQNLRRARGQGYRGEALESLSLANEMSQDPSQLNEIRREAVAVLGDFIGLEPIDHTNFDAEVSAIALHPKESVIVVGMRNGGVQFLDPITGDAVSAQQNVDHAVAALQFHPNEQKLVCIHRPIDVVGGVTGDGGVTFFELNDGQWRPTETHSFGEQFRAAQISMDCLHVTTLEDDSAIVWDLGSRARVAECSFRDVFNVESSRVSRFCAAEYSHLHGLLVVAFQHDVDGNRRGMVIWDVNNESVTKEILLDRGTAYSTTMAFSRNSDSFAYGTDRALAVYDVPSFEQRSLQTTFTMKATEFCPETAHFITVDMSENVFLWNSRTGNPVAELTHPRTGDSRERVAISRDLLAASCPESVRVWRRGTPERQELADHDDAVPTIKFVPNLAIDRPRPSVAAGSADGSVSFHDAETGAFVFRVKANGAVQGIDVSSSGQWLAVGLHEGNDPEVELWDLGSRQRVALATHSLGKVRSVRFTDETHFAAACEKGVAVWQLPNERGGSDQLLDAVHVEDRTAFDPSVKCYCVWPLQSRLVFAELSTVADARKVRARAWDWENEQQSVFVDVSAVPLHSGWHGLATIPNSAQIAYVNRNGQVKIQSIDNAASSDLIGAIGDFGSPHLAISPDGKRLAAKKDSRTVTVWDIATKTELYTFRSEPTQVYSLEWHANGDSLYVGTNSGSLVRWDLYAVENELRAYSLYAGD